MKILESSLRRIICEALEEPVREKLEMPLPSDLLDIHKRINQAGKDLYVVGGAVRDILMNKTPKDYDLATNALPDQVIKILDSHGRLNIDLQGKSFGVVRVKTPDGNEYEIATFRQDIGAGRRPEGVEFTNMATDAQRRDLTMNALFYDIDSSEVIDYVGGIDDIRGGVAKAVGDPAKRFEEDKLRMLRAARFAGRSGFELDSETAEAIRDDAGLRVGDGRIQGEERITDEFKKGLATAVDPEQYIAMLSDLGLLNQIFQGLSFNPAGLSSVDNLMIQIALLLRDNDPQDVSSTMQSLRYSNEEKNLVDFLLRFKNIIPESAPSLKKLFDRRSISDSYLYDFIDASGEPSRKIADAFLEFVSATPAMSPKELMAQGITGPALGKALSDAEIDFYKSLIGENILRAYVQNLLIDYTRY